MDLNKYPKLEKIKGNNGYYYVYTEKDLESFIQGIRVLGLSETELKINIEKYGFIEHTDYIYARIYMKAPFKLFNKWVKGKLSDNLDEQFESFKKFLSENKFKDDYITEFKEDDYLYMVNFHLIKEQKKAEQKSFLKKEVKESNDKDKNKPAIENKKTLTLKECSCKYDKYLLI